jgi:hypothetical protein
MAGEILVYDSANRYASPPPARSGLMNLVDRFTQRPPANLQAYYAPQEPGHAAGFISTLRQYSEGVIVGGVAGILEAELKNGLDVGGVPIDGAAAGVAALGAVLMRGSEASGDVQNVGSSCATIYSFRMMNKLRKQIIRSKGGTPGGTTIAGEDDEVSGEDEDPIVRAAKAIGGQAE